MKDTSHHETVFRAGLPQVLFVDDLALALRCSPSTARRLIRQGLCGPHLRVGRRLAVLRASLLAALEARARGAQEGSRVL